MYEPHIWITLSKAVTNNNFNVIKLLNIFWIYKINLMVDHAHSSLNPLIQTSTWSVPAAVGTKWWFPASSQLLFQWWSWPRGWVHGFSYFGAHARTFSWFILDLHIVHTSVLCSEKADPCVSELLVSVSDQWRSGSLCSHLGPEDQETPSLPQGETSDWTGNLFTVLDYSVYTDECMSSKK